MPPTRSRAYVFTINNYTATEEAALQATAAKYLVYGRETGESGTPHLQGYIRLNQAKSISALSRQPGFERAHIEPRRGSETQASDYCKKDGDFYELGELSKQGQRTDLEAVREDILEGKDELEIANTHFKAWTKYHNSFSKYRALITPPRNSKTRVEVLWGGTGLGKSRYAKDMADARGGGVYYHVGDRWFDGYTGQKNVIFDDFDGSQVAFRQLLRLLDRYPMDVPIKGGFAIWNPKTIYITSNVPPSMWYQDQQFGPLRRRLEEINNVKEPLYDDIVLQNFDENNRFAE